jgi:superfamily II DNA or RNA helicase
MNTKKLVNNKYLYIIGQRNHLNFIKIGITRRPLGYRLDEYMTGGNYMYLKVFKLECSHNELRYAEKIALASTIDFVNLNNLNREWREWTNISNTTRDDLVNLVSKYLLMYTIQNNISYTIVDPENYNMKSNTLLQEEKEEKEKEEEKDYNKPHPHFESIDDAKALMKKLIDSSCSLSGKENAIKVHKHKIIASLHQKEVLDIVEDFYTSNKIGKIIWACGLGKALLSILLVEKLKFKSIVIGVPSNNLQKQISQEILKIYPSRKNILFVGGGSTFRKFRKFRNSNSTSGIVDFLNSSKSNNSPRFIITTYHSCKLLVNSKVLFDFKIGDEAHHLAGIDTKEDLCFRSFHKISSTKTLFMTATEKIITAPPSFVLSSTSTKKTTTTISDRTIISKKMNLYSMDDESIFGKYIGENKSVQWAIENKKITDYNILVLKNTGCEVDTIISSLSHSFDTRNFKKEIFISSYMCLKSFEKYNDLTHLLLYTNSVEDSELAQRYIDILLASDIINFNSDEIYNKDLHSKSKTNLEFEIAAFKKSTRGIISCVHIFGEGFDLPKLNGVCIAGNMKSEIRIVQYLLRPNRLDSKRPDKQAYIIIPYIDSDDWNVESQSYKNVRSVVSQMRNVDENIEKKIILGIFSEVGDKDMRKNEIDGSKIVYEYDISNTSELNKIKMRLRHSLDLPFDYSEEQDEYNYVRSINKGLNFKSKVEYSGSISIHSNFIKNAEEYFKTNGVWKGWYHFLGVDDSIFIKTKDEWVTFCNKNKVKTLEDYNNLSENHDILPKDPVEVYKDFTNIGYELKFKISHRRIYKKN